MLEPQYIEDYNFSKEHTPRECADIDDDMPPEYPDSVDEPEHCLDCGIVLSYGEESTCAACEERAEEDNDCACADPGCACGGVKIGWWS
jgi:hypothetical protein